MRVDEITKNGGLYSKRVLVGLIDTKTQEHQVVNIVKGRGKYSGRQYIYYYWPSDKSNCSVRLYVETNLETGEQRPSEEFYNLNDVDKFILTLTEEEKINDSRKEKLDDILK